MKYLNIILVFVLLLSCKKEEAFKRNPIEIITDQNISVEVYDFVNFETFLNQKDDQVYVINFWATWCKPCVDELPAFIALHEKYQSKNVKVILVSLDFPTKIKDQLIPFIKNKGVTPEVVLLDDPDQNTWIPKVSEKWSGAIPATLIYTKNKREFYEQSFEFKNLEERVLSIKK